MFCDKANVPISQNKPDTPNIWLAEKSFHNNLCVYAFMYYHISCLMYGHICFTSYHYINHWFTTFCVYLLLYLGILYDECSEDVTGEYISAKYQ